MSFFIFALICSFWSYQFYLQQNLKVFLDKTDLMVQCHERLFSFYHPYLHWLLDSKWHSQKLFCGFYFISVCLFFAELGIKPKPLHMLGKYSTMELYPQPVTLNCMPSQIYPQTFSFPIAALPIRYSIHLQSRLGT